MLFRSNASVDDKALEATIDVLRKQRTRWNAVDRAGKKGDRATIDFVGKLDGEAFPGGSAEGFPMVLGEGRMLPDFEAGVLGKKAGETVTFNVKFPRRLQRRALGRQDRPVRGQDPEDRGPRAARGRCRLRPPDGSGRR